MIPFCSSVRLPETGLLQCGQLPVEGVGLAVEGEERLTAGPGLAEGEEVRPAVVDGGAAEVVLAAGGTWRVPQLEQKVPGLG